MKQHKYDVEQVEKPNVFKNFDYFLLAVVFLIAVIGVIVLYSAMSSKSPELLRKTMMVQIGGLLLGLVTAVIVGAIDYHIYKQLAIFFYGFNIIIMLLVYSPIGMVVNGSRSWLNFGFITYQPSELMKIATIVMIAVCLEDFKAGNHKFLNAIRILFFFSLPFGLVILQKDFGTAMVFMIFFVAMLFISGLKYRYFISVALAGIISFPFVWKYALDGERKTRILSFLDPSRDPLNSSWQASQARYAIGSGQLLGKGLGNGPLNMNNRIPVKDSDFIFSVIGEELGFIGCSLVVILFFLLLVRMISVARKASEPFGNYVVIGVFAMFAFHFIQNIGMNLSLLPITGIPLPFISKGGSSMLTNFFSIGVVLSIAARRTTGRFFD